MKLRDKGKQQSTLTGDPYVKAAKCKRTWGGHCPSKGGFGWGHECGRNLDHTQFCICRFCGQEANVP